MLRYKPSKHVPIRIRRPVGIDIRTTMLYNVRVVHKKLNRKHNLTIVR
jgi:hypothetical protein